VVVAVQDSGVGTDPESVDQLFNAFFTTKASGMGGERGPRRHLPVRAALGALTPAVPCSLRSASTRPK
jgi:hypothetical protein